MKFISILFFSLIILQSSLAQVMWQVKDADSKKWFLQFNDEFDGESLNETKWKSGLPWGNAQYFSDSYFRPENVVLNDHTLKLMAYKLLTSIPFELFLTALLFQKTHRELYILVN